MIDLTATSAIADHRELLIFCYFCSKSNNQPVKVCSVGICDILNKMVCLELLLDIIRALYGAPEHHCRWSEIPKIPKIANKQQEV